MYSEKLWGIKKCLSKEIKIDTFFSSLFSTNQNYSIIFRTVLQFWILSFHKYMHCSFLTKKHESTWESIKGMWKVGKKRNILLVKVVRDIKEKKTKYNCSVPLIKFIHSWGWSWSHFFDLIYILSTYLSVSHASESVACGNSTCYLLCDYIITFHCQYKNKPFWCSLLNHMRNNI